MQKIILNYNQYYVGSVLKSNPDVLSIWNYRRIIILHYFPNIIDASIVPPTQELSIKSVCDDELKLTSAAIAKNPKSCKFNIISIKLKYEVY